MSVFRLAQRIGLFSLFLPLFLVLAACSNKLNMENYNKIRSGQTFDEVKGVLGDPTRCDEVLGIRACVWGDEQRGINVNFLAGQVVLHSARNLK